MRKINDPSEELVGQTEEKRNWRGIIIALLVIVTVLALIVTAIILVTPKSKVKADGAKISFKGFMENEYEPKQFRPIWLPGEEKFLFRNDEGAVLEFDCETQNTTLILDNSTFRELVTDNFRLSADKKYVLHSYDIIHNYRHSTIAKYKIYDVHTKKSYNLIGPDAELQYVTWSPKGHSMIYVLYDDIYYVPDCTTNEHRRLTYGEYDYDRVVFNGVPDWVYEEEILQTDNAIWFSPTGEFVLYAQFDDTDVRTYEMTYYGDMADKYTSSRPLKYPKPGTTNPKVYLKIVHIGSNKTVDLDPPEEFRDRDHYFTTVSWQNTGHVLISWLNRAQNVSIMTVCTATNGKCRTNHRVEAEGGWIEVNRPAIFVPDGSNYFLLLPNKDGSSGSFQHIAMINASDDITTKFIDGTRIFVTAGTWDVTEIVGYDDETKTIYFIATKNGDATMRHLYRTTVLKDSDDYRQVTCMSCDIGEHCEWVEATFTPTGKYYVMACKGPEVPSYHLYSVANGLETTLENNDDMKAKMKGMMLPITKYERIPIEEGSEEYMHAKLLLPPILNEDEIITYNLLFKVYGGPGSQLVTKEFGIGWEHYLCSTHGIIIAFADGRGTGGRGNKWLHSNYKKLGTVEVEDTLTAARHFNKLHYVHERSSIWGLSYGGFLSSSVLGRGTDVFKCGIAVSPVTDWRYYDSAYTERYMGMPTARDNLGAYNAANVSKYASNFKSSKFLLIHGTMDDNVHFQNSAQLIKSLTEADIYYRSQIYADETHFLNGGNTKTHLYNTMEDFILQCFGKPTNLDDINDEKVDKDAEEVEE